MSYQYWSGIKIFFKVWKKDLMMFYMKTRRGNDEYSAGKLYRFVCLLKFNVDNRWFIVCVNHISYALYVCENDIQEPVFNRILAYYLMMNQSPIEVNYQFMLKKKKEKY